MTNVPAKLRLHRRVITTAILSASLFTASLSLISSNAFAADNNVVATRFGKLTIGKNQADEPIVSFNGKTISKEDFGFYNAEKYIKLQKTDVVVVSYNVGGANSMPTISLVEITSPTTAHVIQGADANDDRIKVTQSGEHITIDLGASGKGKHDFLNYQDGKAWVSKSKQK
jgi:hypothetical protein